MKSRDLMSELFAAVESRNADERIGLFKRLGISGQAIVATGAFLATQRVRPIGDGMYEPDERGDEHLIIPVVEGGAIIDLLSFRPADPEHWFLRTGASAVLGEYRIERADWLDEPLRLFPHPLAWLKAKCAGAVILDWRCAPWRLVGIKTLISETYELACKVDGVLNRPAIDFPKIRVRQAA